MSSYEVEKITIKVDPGEDIGATYHKMLEAALEHQCRVYAKHNGKMFTVSYTTLRAQIVKKD